MTKNNAPALQFGAGNIGRGFVGVLLSQAGYPVIFIDVIDPLVDQINEQRQYTVKTIGADETTTQIIDNVSAIHGNDLAAVVEAISQAAIITTAVGPNVLRIIAPTLARGLDRRAEMSLDTPLNIIACENLIDNSKVLRDYVMGHLGPESQAYVESHVGFPCCVVDKVVTDPTEAEKREDPLIIVAEGHGKLIVERNAFAGPPPEIEGMQLTDNLPAYVEQKIFTLNTAHAVTAYLGYLKGYEFIHQALEDAEIRPLVESAIDEVNSVLIKRHGIEPADQQQFAANTLQRFENEAMPDSVMRVGREPKRKLAPNDRLIRPAVLALENDITPHGLATGIAAALSYDHPDDEQAMELQQKLREQSLEAVLNDVAGLPSEHPLVGLVKERMPTVAALAEK